jgi:hypothetical protein
LAPVVQGRGTTPTPRQVIAPEGVYVELYAAPVTDGLSNNTRIVIMAALASIQRECETAIDCPEVSFTSICRIASLARQALLMPAVASRGRDLAPSKVEEGRGRR